MHAMVLCPSVKLILAAYAACGLLELAIAAYWLLAASSPAISIWIPLAVPLFLQLWAAARQVVRLATKLTVSADRIRYESGLLSKTSRVMELAKVQDIRVDQTLGQRLLQIGDLSLETAGETSRLTMASIDRPQQAADHILELSRAQRSHS